MTKKRLIGGLIDVPVLSIYMQEPCLDYQRFYYNLILVHKIFQGRFAAIYQLIYYLSGLMNG